ncbi:MAG TPA: IS21 family transposase [Armatimonadota bacterium]
MREIVAGKPLSAAAAKAGMCEKTGRTWRNRGQSPSATRKPRAYRTRENPFVGVWDEVEELLNKDPDLQALTLFEDLQRRYPGRFQDGQLRTLQRQVKHWRATEGPQKEVFFAQLHRAGDVCESDFCHLTKLGVTIGGVLFRHMLYHFVLTYSNWETGTFVFSESFESLSEGLQNALWTLGGVPKRHRTDSLSAAVRKPESQDEFTQRYQALLKHCGFPGEHISPGRPNENGDVEQRHHRFVEKLDQALRLRGSREFGSRTEYERYLSDLFTRLNKGRTVRFREEQACLSLLPLSRFPAGRQMRLTVGPGSTIRVIHNTYSLPSRLIGETVEAKAFSERIEVRYGGVLVETLPRLIGQNQHYIQYRHVIDSLVRKPGAFLSYRYREDLYPTSRFREAYDRLVANDERTGVRAYLCILEMAAKESEERVDAALSYLLGKEEVLTVEAVRALVATAALLPKVTDIAVPVADLYAYDSLLSREAAYV